MSRLIWRLWPTPFSTAKVWVSWPRHQRVNSEKMRKKDTQSIATVHFPPPEVCVTYWGFALAVQRLVQALQSNCNILQSQMSFLLGSRPGKNGEERHTKSIESLDDIASLLPKGILVQAMTCEAVHLLRFSSSINFSLRLHQHVSSVS